MRISKNDYQKIIQAAIKNGEIGFLKNLIENWVHKYPGDLVSEFFLAKISQMDRENSDCLSKLKVILSKDPEFLPAIRLFHQIAGIEERKSIASTLHVITGEVDSMDLIFPWAITLRTIRTNRKKQNFQNSEKLLKNLFGMDSEQILIAIEKLRLSSYIDPPVKFLEETKNG